MSYFSGISLLQFENIILTFSIFNPYYFYWIGSVKEIVLDIPHCNTADLFFGIAFQRHSLTVIILVLKSIEIN